MIAMLYKAVYDRAKLLCDKFLRFSKNKTLVRIDIGNFFTSLYYYVAFAVLILQLQKRCKIFNFNLFMRLCYKKM